MALSSLSLEDAVLVLIHDGAETVDEIASILRVDRDEVERALKNLELEGLVRREEKGFWIFKKKVYKLTAKGFERAVKAKEKLVQLANEVKKVLEEARSKGLGKEDLEPYIAPYVPILPLLLYFDLIDIALLLPLMELPLLAGLLDGFIIDYGDMSQSGSS